MMRAERCARASTPARRLTPGRPKYKPPWATSKQKQAWRGALMRYQRGICAGCGQPFGDKAQTDRSPLLPTLDHIIPRSDPAIRWVGHNLHNLLLKHRVCNELRGDTPATGCDLVWSLVVRAGMEVERRPR